MIHRKGEKASFRGARQVIYFRRPRRIILSRRSVRVVQGRSAVAGRRYSKEMLA